MLNLLVYLADIKQTTVDTIPKGFILCKRKLPRNLVQLGRIVLKGFALVLEVCSSSYGYVFSVEAIYRFWRVFYYGVPVLVKESFKGFVCRDE